MDGGLTAAIETLYTVFGPVPKPVTVEGCPCCWFPAEAEALLRPVPLRELPAEALQPYAANAMLTIGSPADFRYFLPRLMQIGVVEDGFFWPDIEALLSRLHFAKWTSWAAGERAAVRGFLTALWHDTLTEDPDEGFFTGDVLCAIGNAEDDIAPYLDAWAGLLTAPHPAARLRELRSKGLTAEGRLNNPFWNERPARADQVLAWLGRRD